MGALLYVLIGLAAGVLSGLFGIGGGVVIVPALILLARMSPLEATGTSLGALLLPVGLLGAWEYYRRGQLHVGVALLLALGLFLGAWGGARLAPQLGAGTVRRLFALFLVLMALRLWFAEPRGRGADLPQTEERVHR